ncbi:MAG: tetratricopeptide repeat protein [Spirochaetes bacterium]|jgi:tetratricopeptide (TPR) repeat protein|nr:tetratricopeptide repeat protein [Spirochaetota bacterium]
MSKVKVEQNKFEQIVSSVMSFIADHRIKVLVVLVLIIVIAIAGVSAAVYYDKHQNNIIVQYELILDKYGKLLEEEKSEEAAAYAVEEIIKLSERARWGYIKDNGYYLAAGIQYHNKKYDEALELYTKFVEENPKSEFAPLARIQTAVVLEWLDRSDEAFEIYKQLETDLNGTKFFEQILYDLGRHHQMRGETKKAKDYYGRVISEFVGSLYEKQAKKRLMLINYADTTSK